MNNVMHITSEDTIEIHYYFADDTHFMDANVRNKCEYELLAIIRELANITEFKIDIETEPFGEGGLRQWLKVVSKGENKDAPITAAFLVLILTNIIAPVGKISEKVIENIFEDKEIKDLEKEKIKLEIEKLKQETRNYDETVKSNILIRKRKSNFYQTLKNYPKVEKVSFSIVDSNKQKVSKENFIKNTDFETFILGTNGLEPIEAENAIIEIISPVLKKGRYKWLGIYNGQPVHFIMKSNEFKDLVQNGNIEFKNGSSIICHLQIKREVDEEGHEKLTSYTVVRVNSYFQNHKPVETNEGKLHRQRKEAAVNQLALFSNQEK
jgi:hypothetical protein